MSELDIINVGHVLPEKLTKHLIKQGIKYKVPPSLFICQLYYESNWGNSQVAKDNNNWGGLTWNGKTDRPSGIKVSRGTQRPSNEGGYYMKFSSVEDYLTDYVYLLTEQGIYNIKNKSSFEETVKGLFIVGGAKYDYAAVGATAYIDTMKGVRNGINSRNNNILDKIDTNPSDYVDGGSNPDPEPDPDPDPEPEPDPEPDPEPSFDFSNVLDFFEDFSEGIVNSINKMLTINLYNYDNNKNFGNKYVAGFKMLDNMYRIKPTINLKKALEKIINEGFESLENILGNLQPEPDPGPEPEPEPEPEPDPEPEPSGKPIVPMDLKNLWVTSEYGSRGSGFHWGIDLGVSGNPVNTEDVFATMSGTVKEANGGCASTPNPSCNGGAGNYVTIEHDDGYYSRYLHLGENSITVKVGDKVKQGKVIGKMANSGNSFGSHLHFEISPSFPVHGKQINPRDYVDGLKNVPKT